MEYDTTRRDATGHDATEEVVLSVADAAERLGVSPGAVRKRIERRQLIGRKVAGQWQVVLDTITDTTRHDATRPSYNVTPEFEPRHDATGQHTTAVSSSARSQLEAIRDEWLVPLVDRIGALERENGKLEAERDIAVAEREQLAARVKELETKPAAQLMGELATRPAFQPIAHTPTADTTALESERDTLRSRVAALEAQQAAATTAPASEPQRGAGRAWWKFWSQ